MRAEALRLLDEISRPLTVREIEELLRRHHVSKSKRAVLAGALSRATIIAIVPTESRP